MGDDRAWGSPFEPQACLSLSCAPARVCPRASQGWGGGLLPSRPALLSPVREGFVEGSQISDVPETNNLPLTRSLVSSHNRESTIFLTHCAIKTLDVKEHVAVS